MFFFFFHDIFQLCIIGLRRRVGGSMGTYTYVISDICFSHRKPKYLCHALTVYLSSPWQSFLPVCPPSHSLSFSLGNWCFTKKQQKKKGCKICCKQSLQFLVSFAMNTIHFWKKGFWQRSVSTSINTLDNKRETEREPGVSHILQSLQILLDFRNFYTTSLKFKTNKTTKHGKKAALFLLSGKAVQVFT